MKFWIDRVELKLWPRSSYFAYSILLSLVFVALMTGFAQAYGFSNAEVSPTWGEQGTSFKFSVTYNGSNPGYVRVFINHQPYDMNRTARMDDGFPVYEFTWNSPDNISGSFTHYYEALEGDQIMRGPEYAKGDYFGPQIIEKIPQQNFLYLINSEDGNLLWEHDNGSTWIDSACISSQAEVIAFRDSQGLIKVFSKSSSVPIWSMMTLSGKGNIAVADSGFPLIVASGDHVFAFKDGDKKPEWKHKTNVGEYSSLVLSRNGSFFIAGGDNHHAELFDIRQSKPVSSYSTKGLSAVIAADISGDARTAAVGTACPDRRALIFKNRKLEPVTSKLIGKESPPFAMTLSKDGKYLAIAVDAAYKSGDPGLIVIDTDNGKQTLTYEGRGPMRAIGVSENLDVIAAGGSEGELTCFRDLKEIPAWKARFGGAIGAVAVSRNGRYVAAGSMDRNVVCFDAETGRQLWTHPTVNYISVLEFSPEGRYLIAANGAEKYLGMGVHSGESGDLFKAEPLSSRVAETKSRNKKTTLGTPEFGMIAGIFVILLALAWYITRRFALPKT